MKKLSGIVHHGQNGFTLVEILIAVAISGLLGTGAVMTVGQIFPQNERANEKVVSISQVENVAYWINHDALMAQTVTPDAGSASGFPLTLTWQVPDNDGNQVTRNVVYSISGGSLQRSYTVNDGVPTQTVIALNISSDVDKTNCSYSNGVLTFQVTSTVGATSETRLYQVKLRVDQPSS